MSYSEADNPVCTTRRNEVELLISPRSRDLGGFSVRRVLPAPEHRMVGPFIFFDEMGPAEFPPGKGLDVRPHPHIGLATVTYLFSGEILHRDSLGYVQPIRPGAVNLMTAGRGIVHSERTAPGVRESGQRLHGIQTWMALPDGMEEIRPAFEHVPADRLPVVQSGGMRATVIFGRAFGAASPVSVHGDTLYADVQMQPGCELALPREPEALAAYCVEGSATIGECVLPAHSMAVFGAGQQAVVRAAGNTRLMLLGGASPGHREIFWNFVSSTPDRIEQAKSDWRGGRFAPVPGDDEFIPLP